MTCRFRAAAFAVLLLVAGMASASRAGLVSFRRLAIPDEVPAHLTTALAQDRQGFLWIGTQAGLVRFDGSRFEVFRSNPEDPATLGGSYVRSLLAARDGRLCVGTFGGGLSVYDPARETFTRYRNDPQNPASLSHDRVEALAEDRSGRIWVATNEGVDRLDPRSGRIEHFRHDPADLRSLADDLTRALLVDREGRLWAGTIEHGAAVLDPRTSRVTSNTQSLRNEGLPICTVDDDSPAALRHFSGGALANFPPKRVEHLGADTFLQFNVPF